MGSTLSSARPRCRKRLAAAFVELVSFVSLSTTSSNPLFLRLYPDAHPLISPLFVLISQGTECDYFHSEALDVSVHFSVQFCWAMCAVGI